MYEEVISLERTDTLQSISLFQVENIFASRVQVENLHLADLRRDACGENQ